MSQAPQSQVGPPLWLLAEVTYRCPLQCPYCSNPLDFAHTEQELTTEQWVSVLRQGRAMGAAQLGFSGGEPLVRQDLPELIAEARGLGYYTNLITSGIGLNETKVRPSARPAWTTSRSASRPLIPSSTTPWRAPAKRSSRSLRWRGRSRRRATRWCSIS